MNLKKILERYLRVNLLGPGPRLIKKNYRAAVSQRLRNTGLEDPSSLIRNGWRVCFSGNKAPGGGVNHSPPSSAEVKNEWNNVFTLSTPSWLGQQQVYLHLYLSQYTGVNRSGTSTQKCSREARVAADISSSMWPRRILCSRTQQWKIFRSQMATTANILLTEHGVEILNVTTTIF